MCWPAALIVKSAPRTICRAESNSGVSSDSATADPSRSDERRPTGAQSRGRRAMSKQPPSDCAPPQGAGIMADPRRTDEPRHKEMLKNLAQVTSVAAERFGSKPALVFEGRWFSFGEIDALACRLANALKGMGIKPGDRV